MSLPWPWGPALYCTISSLSMSGGGAQLHLHTHVGPLHLFSYGLPWWTALWAPPVLQVAPSCNSLPPGEGTEVKAREGKGSSETSAAAEGGTMGGVVAVGWAWSGGHKLTSCGLHAACRLLDGQPCHRPGRGGGWRGREFRRENEDVQGLVTVCFLEGS